MNTSSAFAIIGVLSCTLLLQQPVSANEEPLSLYVLDCGAIHGMESARFLPGLDDRPERLELANRCYLVDHPAGILLWDLGFPGTLYYRILARLFWVKSLGRSSIEIGKPLIDQLHDLGFEPSDINFVATSHMHFDHVGAANQFAGSTWLVQKDERDWAFSEDLDVEYVDSDLFSALASASTIELSGDYDVFGDGRVIILSSPGHTPGHQCLFVDLAEAGPIILSGDLYHSQLNRDFRIAPQFNVDRSRTLASMQVIEDFASAHAAALWIQHDPSSGPAAPAVLR